MPAGYLHQNRSPTVMTERESASLFQQPSTNLTQHILLSVIACCAVFVGPCHHSMARPQVADGGTASEMECSCE